MAARKSPYMTPWGCLHANALQTTADTWILTALLYRCSAGIYGCCDEPVGAALALTPLETVRRVHLVATMFDCHPSRPPSMHTFYSLLAWP